MSRRSWTLVALGAIVSILLVGTGALWGDRALTALGWVSDGGVPTIAPDTFTPPPTPVLEEGVGVVGLASGTQRGAPVNGAVLKNRIAELPAEGIGQAGWVALDADSGAVLAGSAQATPMMPASTMKLLTGLVAMDVLPHTQRFATKVVSPKPGTIVLVGGGDPYLTALPTEKYPRRASLSDLAAKTAEQLKAQGVSSVVLKFEDSLFTGPDWEPSWEPVFAEDVTRVSPLISDMGVDPATKLRSTTPAKDAATKFAAALTQAGVVVAPGFDRAKGEGTELASVESMPLRLIVQEALMTSDNTATETVLRHVAIAKGKPASFVGGAQAITEYLKDKGLWQDGTLIVDGSGVSRKSRVSALTLAKAARLVETDQKYRVLNDALPVAGVTGTLRNRFTQPGAMPGRGVVRAKTGSLRDASALVGLVHTKDGRSVSIAFITNAYANGWNAKVWIDDASAVVAGCGCR